MKWKRQVSTTRRSKAVLALSAPRMPSRLRWKLQVKSFNFTSRKPSSPRKICFHNVQTRRYVCTLRTGMKMDSQ